MEAISLELRCFLDLSYKQAKIWTFKIFNISYFLHDFPPFLPAVYCAKLLHSHHIEVSSTLPSFLCVHLAAVPRKGCKGKVSPGLPHCLFRPGIAAAEWWHMGWKRLLGKQEAPKKNCYCRLWSFWFCHAEAKQCLLSKNFSAVVGYTALSTVLLIKQLSSVTEHCCL